MRDSEHDRELADAHREITALKAKIREQKDTIHVLTRALELLGGTPSSTAGQEDD